MPAPAIRSRPRRAARLLRAGLLLGLALPGCRSPQPEAPPPNIVLISIDSLRPDHLGLYGYQRPTSPELDRIAADAVVFERAWSTTTWTLPSHLSMLTGLVPSAHGVRGHGHRLPESAQLLPELLAPAGYRSAAVVSGPFLSARFGYDQGWESYDESLAAADEESHDYDEVTSEELHGRAVALLDRLAPGPFFLFLHSFDVHYDYIPPPPYDTMFDSGYEGAVDGRDFVERTLRRREMPMRDLEHLVALYDGEIRWVDGWIGRLYDELRRRQLLDRTLVVVTADHGDEFLEHRRFGHSNNLFDTTLRVPLIVRPPGGRPGGERRAAPASLVDLVPTLLAAAGLETPAGLDGRDLLGAAGSGAGPRPVFAELFTNRHAVVAGGWKAHLVRQGGKLSRRRTALYDLERDPGEADDVAGAAPDRAADLRQLAEQHLDGAARRLERIGTERAPRDEELEARLRALGYL
ncbi:MAG TPA: sulfatase [Thermoanaerobaculia bacterium]|nr:sulfatase [Thermoanaerobaculia bacterium]